MTAKTILGSCQLPWISPTGLRQSKHANWFALGPMSRSLPMPTVEINPIKAEVDEIKRRRILEEAVRQFFEKGYDATSLESIAEELGVTKQFIYSRFRNKAELLVHVCRAGATAADKTVAYSTTLIGDPAARLAQVIRYFVKLQIEHRREVALYFREAKSLPAAEGDAINESKHHFHRMLRGLLTEGASSGQFALSDPSLAASALGGMASWAFTWFQPDGRWDAEAVAAELAVLALRTVGVSDPSAVHAAGSP
ncbi:TetR/AcrR family transcriptional regulator [Novosphingobium piscinae]|uniref:TetR/AcrR family transcriptional regulator n=1 Tax=Novosphingobium piscinae TaxID=1507448 RepID=A0A7X1KQH0_9SPHN|nr:TetR/AcrR family transcriptional regulator [Novosphingobium piscinae]MBC2669540.1 TetR/AcrR family transcriptional regulator [Novosphingobium piscinae]